MTHNYTSNQILLYIYNELPALEHLEAEYAIEHDDEWKATYERFTTTLKTALPKIQFFPRHRVVKSILNYSRLAS